MRNRTDGTVDSDESGVQTSNRGVRSPGVRWDFTTAACSRPALAAGPAARKARLGVQEAGGAGGGLAAGGMGRQVALSWQDQCVA